VEAQSQTLSGKTRKKGNVMKKKKAIKWTIEDLKENSRIYSDVMKKLIAAHDKGDKELHVKYAKEEARLDRRETTIRKALGIFVPDPCKRYGYQGQCGSCPTILKKNCIYK
jgi:hypothetical protein